MFPCTALVCLQPLPQQFLQSCCRWWEQLVWSWWRLWPVVCGWHLGAEQTLGASCECAAPSSSAERSKGVLEGWSVTLLVATWNPTAWPNTAFSLPSVKQYQDSHYEIFWPAKLKTRITNVLLIRADTEVLSSTAFLLQHRQVFYDFFLKSSFLCFVSLLISPVTIREQSPSPSIHDHALVTFWHKSSIHGIFGPKTSRLCLHCQHTAQNQHSEKKRALLVDRQVTETVVKEHPQGEAVWGQNSRTLLLYCLEQWGQHTGGVAIVPVSWVWVLSMGSGSPGPAGRSFRMLGGSSAPGWFFRMCALRLLALLYTCRAKIWN